MNPVGQTQVLLSSLAVDLTDTALMQAAFVAPYAVRLRNANLHLQRLKSIKLIQRAAQTPAKKSAATMSKGRISAHAGKPTILVTNDDGVDPDSALAIDLGRALADAGHDVTVVAPGRNNSACGHGVTLYEPLTLRRHRTLESERLHVFSVLEGTPADCAAAAVEPGVGVLARLGRYPRLVVSGVNVGPNFGTDVLYSGTVAAARQAALYGIPAISSSLNVKNVRDARPGAPSRAIGVRATARVVAAAISALPAPEPPCARAPVPLGPHAGPRDAFARGDLLLNVNVPAEWAGGFASTALDSVLYHNAVRLDGLPDGDIEVNFALKSGRMELGGVPNSDTTAVERGLASISAIQTWPWSSPNWVPEDVMRTASISGEDGLPSWLSCATAAAGR